MLLKANPLDHLNVLLPKQRIPNCSCIALVSHRRVMCSQQEMQIASKCSTKPHQVYSCSKQSSKLATRQGHVTPALQFTIGRRFQCGWHTLKSLSWFVYVMT